MTNITNMELNICYKISEQGNRGSGRDRRGIKEWGQGRPY